ncbi:MAG: hypothetical protein K2N27_00040 [Ruminococcus sp.]|nr:hypothetical protein [Ruminococcus sp.]
MKKHLTKIFAGTAIIISLCAVPMTSYGATPEEAEAAARACGMSEEMVQYFWNEYYTNPEKYTPEVIDQMIAEMYATKNMVAPTVPYNPDAQVPIDTTSAVTVPENPDTPTTVTDTPVSDGSITLTMPDGSTITRISKEQFIALSYEEKMTYLSTFTEEQQAVIISNLSPEEYKSMLKQLPMEDKLTVVDSLADVGESMGLNVSVDEISNDNLSYSMKNDNGEIVAVASVRENVENTGYDRRGIFAVAGAFIMTGIAGLFMLVKNCLKAENENE